MRLSETISTRPIIDEKVNGQLPKAVLARVTYPICNVNELNQNNRMYEKNVWDRVLSDERILEKVKCRTMVGAAEHPVEETRSRLDGPISHIVNRMWLDEKQNKVFAEIDIVDTPAGNIINTLLEAGSLVGVSTRAEGELEEKIDEAKGKYMRVIPESYNFETIDFTADPSTYNAVPMSVDRNITRHVESGVKEGSFSKVAAVKILEGLKSKMAKDLSESLVKEDKVNEGRAEGDKPTFAFETDSGSRHDVVANTLKSAVDKVRKQTIIGKLTGYYFKYDKDGLHSNSAGWDGKVDLATGKVKEGIGEDEEIKEGYHLVRASTKKQAEEAAPGCVTFQKVPGGYMAFDTLVDYRTWKEQQPKKEKKKDASSGASFAYGDTVRVGDWKGKVMGFIYDDDNVLVKVKVKLEDGGTNAYSLGNVKLVKAASVKEGIGEEEEIITDTTPAVEPVAVELPAPEGEAGELASQVRDVANKASDVINNAAEVVAKAEDLVDAPAPVEAIPEPVIGNDVNVEQEDEEELMVASESNKKNANENVYSKEAVNKLEEKLEKLRKEYIKETTGSDVAIKELKEAIKKEQSLTETVAYKGKTEIDEANTKLFESEKQITEAVKKSVRLEKAIKIKEDTFKANTDLLKENAEKEHIQRYANALVRNSGYQIPKNSLTLLETCGTEEEVELLFEDFQSSLNEHLLHSNKITEVRISGRKKEVSKIDTAVHGMLDIL